MMPARYTAKPFWEVFSNRDPPLWRAHLALQRRFGYDTILGADGGFILSTGDQVPGDTPEENFVALIRAARQCGIHQTS